MPSPSPISVGQEDSINVQIVSSGPIEARQKPVAPSLAIEERPDIPDRKSDHPTDSGKIIEPAEAITPEPPVIHHRNDETTFVKPSKMLSESVLADHRSSQARQALKQLAPAEQVEQLCNLEAMAQVGAWNKELRPDRIVAYAMADTKISGSDFIAAGAALHSKRDWYRLVFRCHLTPDKQHVNAFEFRLGDEIPKEIWAEHNIPDEDGASD
ncbi:DUF930 domain-containing protein [Agrobacterium sp. rho-8.1]|nr:DUF930 domain-containing protein [Agrobacterium sp. rho-8.1]